MTSDLGGTRRPDGTDPSRPAPAAFSSTEEPVSDAEQWARDGVAPHVDAALAGGEGGGQAHHLERDLAVQATVARAVDDGTASAAQLLEDLVLVPELGGERGIDVRRDPVAIPGTR